MARCRVEFSPPNQEVNVEAGTSLLEAASIARISIKNLCGGDGICGRCKMIVKDGDVSGDVSPKLTREEIRKGFVLACMTFVQSDVTVEIPTETLAKEKVKADRDAERFRTFEQTVALAGSDPSPLVRKVFIELDEPTLANNTADHERLFDLLCRKIGVCKMQTGLKIIKILPKILRDNDFKITATVGLRKEIAEIMNVEGGNTENENYIFVVDVGTTTIVAHLIDVNSLLTLDAQACFNSQGIYGREVTRRMITAEKKGDDELQKMLIEDINQLIENLANQNSVNLKDINAVVCAGNTAMGHFLLGLPVDNIRRYPYVATSVDPPPLRAAEVGIEINPRGLLYSLPGISAWVGSDVTAGILATGIHNSEDIALLVDIGTNGETVIGNREWIVSSSASAGPALEGASLNCGMQAEKGAIEKFYIDDGAIGYKTIGDYPPKGICGSGIIDMVSVLLQMKAINRSGNFVDDESDRIVEIEGKRSYVLVPGDDTRDGRPIYVTESDIENIITAKAAIFAAMKIIVKRLDLSFDDIQRFYIAGAFGNFIDIESAVTIGLIPNLERDRIHYAGNTSIKGAKIAALYKDAFKQIEDIRRKTTYYDLMGANDYVEEFRKALFLPHTDIDEFMVVRK
jgi:uncharacterized 2Fe-2S/4Fe-4S cluster protein (DUF4445 family)